MGEARHDPIRACIGLIQQSADKHQQTTFSGIQLIAHPEFEVRGNLVVPAATRVQTTGRRADDLFQPRFNIHVYVFKSRRELKRPRINF